MTICALSSAPGSSGVAVIRISGPETKNLIKKLIKKELPRPRMATLLELYNINNSSLIDEGIVLWFLPQTATQVRIWQNYMFMEAEV